MNKNSIQIQRIWIETPYSGKDQETIDENVKYAWKCVQDSYSRPGEAPLCSHLIWTRFPLSETQTHIDDLDITQKIEGKGRQFALEASNEWKRHCDKVVFYVDRGMSNGMQNALEFCVPNGIPIEMRKIGI